MTVVLAIVVLLLEIVLLSVGIALMTVLLLDLLHLISTGNEDDDA